MELIYIIKVLCTVQQKAIFSFQQECASPFFSCLTPIKACNSHLDLKCYRYIVCKICIKKVISTFKKWQEDGSADFFR